MKTIELDLDGVLYDWHDVVFRSCKEESKIDKDMSLKEFWTRYVPSLSKEYQDYIVNIPLYYEGISLSDDARDFLKWCDSQFQVLYVTSRPKSAEFVTERYLKSQKFPQKENLIFTDDKLSIARVYKVFLAIDDMPKHLENLSKCTNVLMYAQPWNVDFREKYTTIFSFKQAIKLIEEM